VLFEAGANVIVQDRQGRTPLYLASAMGRIECASYLCEVGVTWCGIRKFVDLVRYKESMHHSCPHAFLPGPGHGSHRVRQLPMRGRYLSLALRVTWCGVACCSNHRTVLQPSSRILAGPMTWCCIPEAALTVVSDPADGRSWITIT
jgi:hypothetical protein